MFKSYDESIGQLTSETNKKMLRYLNGELEQYNITLEQWNVLFSLGKQDKINQRNLAEKVNKDQPTLARILDILERKKLIERLTVKEDRRAYLIHMTEEGRKLQNEVADFLELVFKKILQGITEEKLTIYTEVLTQIDKNIINQRQGENN